MDCLPSDIDHNVCLKLALVALEKNNLPEAIEYMRQATEIAPTNVVYRRNLGELLRRIGQLETAISSHKFAVNLEPNSPENHFHLGLTYNDNRQFELAIEHYHIALSYNPFYGIVWNNLGASLESIGDKGNAKVAYITAIAINPNHAEAQNNLAAIYSEEGKLDEARTHFSAAIAANPHFIDAHYNLSLLKSYTLEDPHLNYLESLIPRVINSSIPVRIKYYFAYGKALDDTKQYDRAFKAYAEGNRLHSLNKPWNKTPLLNFVESLPQIFTPSFNKKPEGTETRCPIFIVGMPRAGTTLIEQILSSHSDVYGAGELTTLDNVIHEVLNKNFPDGIKQLSEKDFIFLGKKYLDQVWKLAPEKNFIVDKMPGNCFYIGMIYRIFPNVKIIHAMRDPMDSCFSCFTHLFKDNMSFAYDLTTLGSYYTLYAKTMEYWHSVLPKQTIFDLSYERMIEDPETSTKQLLDYIGLPWDSNCLHFYHNNRVVKTASLTQVRNPIYKTSVQRWRHFENELQPLLKIVAAYREKL